MHERRGICTIQRLYSHQNVGDRALQSHKLDALTRKAGLAGIDPSTL